MALVYHKNHNIFTCVCEEKINAEHTCEIEVSHIKVVVCSYIKRFYNKDTDKFCSICDSMDRADLYAEQWESEERGHYTCAYCGVDTDGELPKECCCYAYIDEDGETRCKTCEVLWTQGYNMEEECMKCIEKKFTDQWEIDESGRFKCAECGEDTDGRSLPKKCSCITFIDHDGRRKCKNCLEGWYVDIVCGKCGYSNQKTG